MEEECDPPPEKKLRSEAIHVSKSPEDAPLQAVEKEGQGGAGPGRRFGKRNKFALLLSYNGSGYKGMQWCPDVPTIERDLLAAMRKAQAFPECMEEDLAKLHFQRCARTDKGVSAARQLVSIKISPDMLETLEDPVTQINAHLPPQIRVMSVKRVTRSFDSRHACGARRYEYLLPTYAFAPYHLTTASYRITDSTLSLVGRLLAYYEGTHNYHNFTSGKKFSDMSANRYITSFKTGEAFVGRSTDNPNGKEIEFLPLRVKGQSFVLHQIRKMIGFVIAVVRGLVQETEFDRVFQEEKVDIPKAPPLGLFLDNVYFDGYNARYCNSGERERLEWQDMDSEIETFKKQYIYHNIIETEIKEMSMMSWLHTLQLHNFNETATRLKDAKSAVGVAGTDSSIKGLNAAEPTSSSPDTADPPTCSTDTADPPNIADLPTDTADPPTDTADLPADTTEPTLGTDTSDPPTCSTDTADPPADTVEPTQSSCDTADIKKPLTEFVASNTADVAPDSNDSVS